MGQATQTSRIEHALLTQRRRGHGRLTLAIGLSVGVHAALLLLARVEISAPEWGVDAEPVEVAVVVGSAGETADEMAAIDGVESEVAESPAPRSASARGNGGHSQGVVDTGGAVGAADEAADEPEASDGAALPERFEATAEAAVVAETSQDGSLGGVELAEPLVDRPMSAPIVAARHSPLPRQSLSAPEHKMLAKKVADWGETFQRKHVDGDELVWKHEGQRYTARFTSLPGGDETALDRFAVDIETEQNGHRLSTTLQLKRLAFSNFAQFVNRWDDQVQIHDDELDGRFHSNTEINLSYTRKVGPKFLGKVTTSARTVNVTERRGYRKRDDIFLGGLETGVRSIRLPRDYVPLPETLAIDPANRQEFSEDARIVFHDDGSYTYVSTESGLFERRGTLRKPASYLIATGKAELDVRGLVRGRVLVYSPTKIVISGDLTYANDPQTGAADDYIGLVSAKTIEIAGPKVTGPGDLTVQAAIYAERRFRVREFRRRNEGTLEIFGSLTAGSLSATEPRYATRIRFDPRLEDRRPPGFPVTDRYEVEEWDEVWMVESVAPTTARTPGRGDSDAEPGALP